MKLLKNNFKHSLKAKSPQLGLWVSLANNATAEIVAGSGFDWVVIDTEHSTATYQDVLGQLQAFNGSKTTALVRPDWNDPLQVKRLLDMGVQGLVFPMIQTVEEAKKAIASTRYPPNGIRGVAGMSRATGFGRIPNYSETVEDETSIILQLETQSALSLAEDIADLDGVDGIFFGPADIAADLGYLGKAMAKEVWDVILPVADKLIAKGMPVGTLVLDTDFAAELLDRGFSFVACGTDAAILSRGSDSILADVKSNMKK